MPIVPCPEYELPILQAVAESDRQLTDLSDRPDGYQFSYSSTDFRDRVYEIIDDILTC